MAKTTANLGLTKPSYSDLADVSVLNSNMDLIDGAIKSLQDTTSSQTSQITALQGSVAEKTSTRVKGNEESSYRTGDVNLTPEDIGALDEDDYLGGMTWNVLGSKFTWDDLAGSTSGDAHTANLNLSKPARLSPTAMNGNMDVLDAKIGAVGNTSLQAQVNNRVRSVQYDESGGFHFCQSVWDVSETENYFLQLGNHGSIDFYHYQNGTNTKLFSLTSAGKLAINNLSGVVNQCDSGGPSSNYPMDFWYYYPDGGIGIFRVTPVGIEFWTKTASASGWTVKRTDWTI